MATSGGAFPLQTAAEWVAGHVPRDALWWSSLAHAGVCVGAGAAVLVPGDRRWVGPWAARRSLVGGLPGLWELVAWARQVVVGHASPLVQPGRVPRFR
jgi:hypothetical protein